MPIVIRDTSPEERTTASATMGILIALLVLVAFALGYFLWYAPSQAAANAPVIERQTDVVHDAPSSTTVIAPPAASPTIIQGSQGPPGATGAQGPQGAPAPASSSASTPSSDGANNGG